MSQFQIDTHITYPKQARTGLKYLMTVDIDFDMNKQGWSFEKEEISIRCLVSTRLFKITFPPDPVLHLHRFGGTYGELRFMLKASDQEREGKITIILQNPNSGLPIDTIELDSKVVSHSQKRENWQEVVVEPKHTSQESDAAEKSLEPSPLPSLPKSFAPGKEEIEGDLQLTEYLKQCTVRIDTENGHGTGFFIAPGLILTCAHVVQELDSAPTIFWNNQNYPVQIERLLSSPDIAMLKLNPSPTEHLCIFADTSFEIGDTLYSYGYADYYPNGEETFFSATGTTTNPKLLKFIGEQVRYGMSGSPLLNIRTGAVCGIIGLSRDLESDLGGRAIPIDVVFETWPDIRRLHDEYHQTPSPSSWKEFLLPREAIDTFEKEARSVFVVYGDGVDDKIINAFAERYKTSLSKGRLYISLNMSKKPSEGYNSLAGVLSEILYQLIDQCLENIPASDVLHKTSNTLAKLKRIYQKSSIPTEKLRGFIEWVMCPDLKKLWEPYNTIIVSVEGFEYTCDWGQAIYDYIIKTFLKEIEHRSLRFVFFARMEKQPEFYAGSNQRDRDNVLDNFAYFKIAQSVSFIPTSEEFDVFMLYNEQDSVERQQAQELADELKQREISVWLQDEQIPSGRSISAGIQEIIARVKCLMVLIGKQELGNWKTIQLQTSLSQAIKRGLPILPVLLPGVQKFPEDHRLLFLQELQAVRFKEMIAEHDALDALVWGITGQHPTRSKSK